MREPVRETVRSKNSWFAKPMKSLVGPAGPPRSSSINDLGQPETIETPDSSRCLSQPIVSAKLPDKLKMRNRPAANGTAFRSEKFNTVEDSEKALQLQARRLVTRFGFPYETAMIVSALAFAVAR